MRAFAKRLEAIEARVVITAPIVILLIIDDDHGSYFGTSGRTSSNAKANWIARNGALPDTAQILEIYFDDAEQTDPAASGS